MLGENGEHSCQAGIPTYPLDQEDEFGEEEEEEPAVEISEEELQNPPMR